MRICLQEVGGSPILAGALVGRQVLCELITRVAKDPAVPEPVFLDFADIEVATASFLRESVLAFRDIVRRQRSTYYPVIANANDAVRDELVELLCPRGDVLMACTLDASGAVVDPAPIGDLDPKQRMTFDLVRERGETDARELMCDYGESEGVKQTAWNNRLASLATLGLLVEVSQGRAKRYKPLFEGV